MKLIAMLFALLLVGCGTPPTKTVTTTTSEDGSEQTVSEMYHRIPNIACKGKGNIAFNINVHASAAVGGANTNQVNANMDCGDGFMYYHPTPEDIEAFLETMEK